MPTIGERLRQAREAKGYSLEDVSRATKIHVNVLAAIEADRAAETLNTIYLQGFLRTYSRYVGQDEASILASLSVPAQVSAPRSAPAARAKAPRTVPPTIERAKDWLVSARQHLPWRPVMAGVLAVLVLWLGALVVHGKRRTHPKLMINTAAPAAKPATRPKPAPSSKPTTNTPAAATAKRQPAKIPRTAPAAATAAPSQEGARLTAQIHGMTWTEVRVDGAIVLQQVLQTGARQTWVARRDITLWLGDAGNVTLELNGRSLGRVGKKGEVVRGLRITREGLQR